MGCKPSTPVQATNGTGENNQKEEVLNQRYKDNLRGIGQTERQISNMLRDAMNNTDNKEGGKATTTKTSTTKSKNSAVVPKLNGDGQLSAEEVARRTFSSISNQEATLGTSRNATHVQVRSCFVFL